MAQIEQAQTPAYQGGRPYPPPGRPEAVWPVQLSILGAIALQVFLPSRVAINPTWLLPTLEGALLVGLTFAEGFRVEREHRRRRVVGTGLIAIVTGANIYSLVELNHHLLRGMVHNGRELIFAGLAIWLTNVFVFALWFWELDRGGPGKRATGTDGPPDFLFPQLTDDRIEPLDWRPQFIDYLYVSVTNSTAFSPTDTMPLTPWAKVLMGTQGIVSLVTLGLIISRAVNILQ